MRLCFCHHLSLNRVKRKPPKITTTAIQQCVKVSLWLIYVRGESFFFVFDLIANCSQITRRHDVQTLSPFKSLTQTATCQRAEHEKWRDCIYPAYSTLACVHFLHFWHFWQRAIITGRENIVRMNGKTERLQELKYSSSTLYLFSRINCILAAFRAAAIIFSVDSSVDYFVYSSGFWGVRKYKKKIANHSFPELKMKVLFNQRSKH